MSFEFVIPLAREDLTRRSAVSQYVVDEVFTVRILPAKIQECRSTYRTKGPLAILDTFDSFYSVLRHFYGTDPELKEDAWDILMKAVPAHSTQLVEVLERDDLASSRQHHLNAVKMQVYLVCQFVDIYEAEVTKPTATVVGKGKKKAGRALAELGSIDWDYERERAVRGLLQLLQLHIHRLWDPPVVEEEFVNLVSGCCYKLLENQTVSKNKATRDVIFQLLGTLVKKFNHGLSCSLKFVQLLQHFEHLASPLASALEIFANEFNSTTIVGDIMREIGRIDAKDLSRDTSGTRAYSAFLVELAEKVPAVMMPSISVLLALLDGESYTMRNSVLSVLGEMVVRVLSREDLDDKEKNTRDQFLDKLEDHLHDVHAFVRSKVLQIWLQIINAKALPLPRQHTVVQLVIGRLKDKSSSVRRYAIQVTTALLKNNPFAAKLSVEELKENYEKEKEKLQQITPDTPAEDTPEDKARKEAEEGWGEIEAALRQAVVEVIEGADKTEDDMTADDQSTAVTDDDTPETVKDRVLAQLKAAEYAEAVKLYSQAVEAFPGNPFFKAGSSEDVNSEKEGGEETAANENEGEERVCKLLQGLKVVFFCETLSSNILEAMTRGPKPASQEEQRLATEISKQQMLVTYLKDSLAFTQCLQQAIPTISQLLGSKNITDVLEAVQFFVTGFEFGVSNAMLGIRRMMALMWSKEQNVKDAVVTAYRRLYLHPDAPNHRAKAIAVAGNLTALTFGATVGDLTSLEELVAEFVRSGDLEQPVIQVLWERFALKIPNTTPSESRGALQLLAMAAGAEVAIVRSNVEVLVKEGLGPRGETDFLLTRDVCIALNKLAGAKKAKAGTYEEPHRFPQDHEIFERLVHILVNGVTILNDRHWLPMAEQAVTVIYKMAEHPDVICGDLIKKLATVVMSGRGKGDGEAVASPAEDEASSEKAAEENMDSQPSTSQQQEDPSNDDPQPSTSQSQPSTSQGGPALNCQSGVLSRLLSVCGHVALRQLVLLDCDLFNELKRRHAVQETDAGRKKEKEAKEKKAAANKRKSLHKAEDDEAAMEEELGLAGAAAEDAEAEYIRRITETQLLSAENLLGLLRPLLVSVCKNQVKYPEPELRAAASLALAKFMMVSSEFCEEHLQLLFTILEKSPYPAIRANTIIALGDLNFRFPNQLEPWTANLYGRLRDEAPKVRKNTLMVLTHLILNDMVKVKGQISELATCIVDDDERIAGLSKLFFFELARKGNAIYNIMPDMVSRLSDAEIGVDEDSFRTVMKYLFSFIQKERQCESLVEKLCHRFRATRSERQWRDLAYCLSMLSYSEKSVRKLQENFTCFHDKLHEPDVYSCFTLIINNAKKFSKPDARALVEELEERLEVCHSKGVEDEEAVNKATKASRALREKGNRRSPKKSPGAGRGRGRTTRTPRKKAAQLVLSDEEEDEDFLHPARSRDRGGGGGKAAAKGKKGRHKPSFSSDEEEEEEDSDMDLLAVQDGAPKENGDMGDSDSEKDADSENKDPNMSGDSSSTAEPIIKKSRQRSATTSKKQAAASAENTTLNGRPRRSNRKGAVK